MLLHQQIELQAACTPDAVAVRYAGHSLTYAELDRHANRCARYLRELGVGPDVIVGLLMDRSLEMSVALLAILKAGGAYLPLDTAYPEARLDFLLGDSGTPIVISQADLGNKLERFAGTVLTLDLDGDLLRGYDATALDPVNDPDDLAYVIYTSGSTGQPKGCMLTHQAICNRLVWMQETYRLNGQDRVLQKTPYTFDVSVWELFWPLMAGATLVFAKPQGHKDSCYLTTTIHREGITVCHFVPSMLRFFLDDPQVSQCTSLRDVFTSGEALPFELVRRFKERLAARLHNLYGPTEAAVDVSHWPCEIRPDKLVPIGRAITGIRLHVLNERREPVARGEEGELYIAGVGLARGYLNRPELTEERFVPYPFGEPGSRMYRTGDRVRELEDGNLEFLGRFDFQVKLRGLRIELGEIEATLQAFPGVNEAAVLVRGEEEGDPKLVAYLEPAGVVPDFRAVRDFVHARLPEYMVPNIVAVLERLPVTLHGKLDRKALPWPVASGPQAAPVAEATAVKPSLSAMTDDARRRHIAGFVSTLLQGIQVEDEADLFDLGATSLTLVCLVEWIRGEFGVEVPVEVFLDAPSVRGIDSYLLAHGVTDAPAGPAVQTAQTVGPCAATAEPSTALPAVTLREDAYLPPTPVRFAAEPVSFAAFSAWMGLLGAEEQDGRHRYLHPSGGGLNAVRTYIAVKPEAVQGLAGGVYYFQPVEHTLHRVGEVSDIGRTAFSDTDRAAFDSAALAVFFIAELDAIAPIYHQHTGVLVAVEAGYMAQLLMSRQASFGLATRAAARVDFGRIEAAFRLAENERFVHCLLAGAAPAEQGDAATDDRLSALRLHATPSLSGATLSHRTIEHAPTQAPLSKELTDRLHDEHRHLRDVSALPAVCRLADAPFAWDDYRLRGCQREYESGLLPLSALSGLLTLFKSRPGNAGAYLYGSPTGKPGFRLYLYARCSRIEGLTEGTYRYDDTRHALVPCSGLADAAMAQAYSPYNRKHYKFAAFCLFLVAEPYAGLNEDEALHLPLVEAGYLGQLLMERQAEFGLGLCPIGALRFDVVRDALLLGPDALLLHSFTGGVFHQDVPASRQRLVDAVAAPVRAAVPMHEATRGALAIVGLSGRYPGANTPEAFWANLQAGVSSVAPLSAERAALLACDGDAAPAIRAGGYLAQIDCFDNLLFGISPVEARALDPQERVLLETAWACLEDAGYTTETLLQQSPRVGVFVGAMWNDYQSHGVQRWGRQGRVEEFSHHASLANRISYLFNFSGPSVAINTSCSSGMTALHLACESIRRGECDAALVGAVNLVSHAYHARLLETIDFLSKEDACYPFSAQANGWILGEGVGAVLIKRHDAALRDRDHVYATIKGSAIGHSGRTVRFGAPSAQQQERIIRQALADAGLEASDIDYVEAAAPGSAMADAAEMGAVKAVFAGRNAHAPCRVGTVKANVGHLESASVFSQLTKVLYQLRHRQLAPSLNSRPRNPLIALDGTGVNIVEALTYWSPPEVGRPLRALINVVGAAGSEGHLVLEEAAASASRPDTGTPALVRLSAATEPQLKVQARQLLDHVERTPQTRLDDLAFTLWAGRAAMAERLAFVVPDLAGLRDALRAYLAAGEADGTSRTDTWRGRAKHGTEAAPAAGDLVSLARHWVCGGEVEPNAQPSGPSSDARRISLPTYPFERVRHWIGRTAAVEADSLPSPEQPMESGRAADEALHAKVLAYLLRLVSNVTEVPMARLDADGPLEGYGLTSLMIEAMNGKLEADFGPLSKTLFFEVRTLRQLAGYFIEHHCEAAGRRFGIAKPGASASAVRAMPVENRRPIATVAPAAAEGIAIVGLSGRYPKADTLGAFWANLREGIDCIGEIPRARWDHHRYFDSARGKPGKTYSKWGGFIDGVDEFDPMFFGMTPSEAALIDPQERLFLQAAWHALEDAGHTRESLRTALASRVGVFVGVMYGEYQLHASLPGGTGTSGTYGTIANRVSYVLDLHGPSMAVDTLCSSSLTALHLACESIRRGECAAAIAGGVCLSLHPNKYVTHALFGMAASDGRCRSFGEGGDGFVPGEGVGAVLLKPLSQAIAAGDHIYGVIKGTAVNHGGRTNGYTVPDPHAHAELIRSALANAGVEPRAVSYIEAHGTGTALGDPIEIAGLVQAFGASPETLAYCAIGSVKSNIGHCEAAAGIAGLTKVLLQMRHATLVKSLHSEVRNPNIDFSRTPFAVQTETAPWPRPVVQIGGEARELARVAGISSFGAGGANAHVVVEEYVAPPADAVPVTPDHPVAIVLSAKTAEALREQAGRLREAMTLRELTQDHLAEAAYTLQAGREPMEERLALLVSSVEALDEKLAAYLAGEESIEDCYRGQVKRNKESLAAFTADEDLADAIDAWIAKGKLAKLLDLWVKGLVFDWNKLYADAKPRRISLPGYPFARERYWVSQPDAQIDAFEGGASAWLHPLLHRNTSDLSEQRFSTQLRGNAFFLADHLVQGRRVLPGVAYLEMAREALVRAGGIDAASGMRLKRVVWARPVVVGETPLDLHIGLHAEADGRIAYEVYSGEDELHCHGEAEALVAQPQRLDLAALRAQCGRAMLSGEACYAGFAALGLAYGPAFRAIEQIHVGHDRALARLRLQGGAPATGFVLHPGVLDAALQATVGLADPKQQPQLALPFAVEAVEIVGPCGVQMWALVEPSTGGNPDSRVRKFDVALCDDDGVVCVRFKGFTFRVVEGQLDSGLMLLQPQWRAEAAAGAAPDYAERVVLLCGVGVTASALQARLSGTTCVALPSDTNLAVEYAAAAQWLCAELQAIAQRKKGAPVLVQVMVPNAGPRQALAGLAGVLKTARQEQPKLVGQLIALGEGEELESVAAKLAENAASPQDVTIRYVGRERQVAGWQELTAEPPPLLPWKAEGVYLITGGLGGLGKLLAQEIARQARGATLVLTGRRELDDAGRQHVRMLEELGATVEYRTLDVADREAVRQLVLQVQEDHQGLHAIVHAAGVLRDSLLLNKTAQEIAAVLAPKVAGLVNLDEASREIELDWLIAFSSTSAALGNAGQADYAAANGFLDSFAHYRNELVAQGLRHGRTVSVNWPLWKEGGMRIEASSEQAMERLTGLKALESGAGLGALYGVLGAGLGQAMVLHGTLPTIRHWLAAFASRPSPGVARPVQAVAAESTIASGQLKDKAVQHFKRLLARVFKLPFERIDADAPLEKYGIDSIQVVEITTALQAVFDNVSSTLFFEYRTLDALAGYFMKTQPEALAKVLNVMPSGAGARVAEPGAEAQGDRAMAQQTSLPPVFAERIRTVARRSRRRAEPLLPTPETLPPPRAANRDVAIVGLSARYAQARNVDEFWANLKAGKNCITEIPAERWDHRLYFDAERGTAGKAYSKWGGFIDGFDRFDPLFFNIAPREAEFMDPQERLFLAETYASIEDSGHTPATLSATNKVGVFAGVMNSNYGTGTRYWSIANRVSYLFDFQGPSLAVDTACSSSLTALHLALESLASGACDVAIVGGVNLIIDPAQYVLLSAMNMISSGDSCRAFGAQADGFVDGEGVGAAVLKPLEQAIADGDQIYGVVKASAINHGGKTNGYTVPNPHGQAAVIARALREAGIDPRTISYLEAHGTGTSLGDPIEIAGLGKAFGESTQDRQFCAIGSVKSNIGHCESAAGIAGITKVLMQLKHGQLAPSLHAEALNPHIDFSATPFAVQRALGEWKRPVLEVDGRTVEIPRRAGISSFGAGGSNAHVVIEEYIAEPSKQTMHPVSVDAPALVVLSAKNEARLHERAEQLVAAIDARSLSDTDLAALAYTLQVGREAMDARLALSVTSMRELKAKLAAYLDGDESIDGLYAGQLKRNKESMAIFAADEELREAVAKWIERKKFDRVLDLWVRGLDFDWRILYGGCKPRRMSLPTYPFARERYWCERPGMRPDGVSPIAAPAAAMSPALAAADAPARLSLLVPTWKAEQPVDKGTAATGGALIVGGTSMQQAMLQRQYGQAQVADFAAGAGIDEIADALAAHDAFDRLIWIAPEATALGVADDQLIEAQNDGVLHGFRLVKALLAAGYGVKALEWSVLTTQTQAVIDGEPIAPAHAGIHGLIGTLAKEYPNWTVRLIDLPVNAPWPLAEVLALPTDPQGNSWAWRGGQWYRQHLLPADIADPAGDARAPYRQGGVYVVIGGAGGIGQAWSEHVAREYGAQTVWIGRRPLDAEIQARLDRVARVGPAPCYIAADASNRAALERARGEIAARFGPIHGVIHSALVLGDQALANMDEARFAASLASKVDVSVRLAQVFASEPLDFALFFSSLQSLARGAGQSNYAAGCLFKDAFAHRLSQRWPCRVRVMNWGWWGSVGVAAAPAYQARMTQLGLASIEPEEGWAALAKLLGGRHGQLALLKTAASRPTKTTTKTVAPVSPAPSSNVTLDDERLRELGVEALKKLVGGLLRVPLEQLDASESLAAYGIDSISVNQLCGLLGGMFTDVNPALFFDYQTLDDLAGYFLSTQRDALVAWVTTDCAGASVREPSADATSTAETPATTPVPAEAPPALEPQRGAAAVTSAPIAPSESAKTQAGSAQAAAANDIAIVGMACRFPGADSVDAYWRMLMTGAKADNRGPARRWPETIAEFGETSPQSWGAFLDDVDRFDPGFFKIAPLHADAIDPQERLFLMSCWHALEDAGYGSDKWLAEHSRAGEDVGVFVGVTSASYNLVGFEASLAGSPQVTGLSFASISNRVSHALGLTGPSLSVDTMCSASLVALHMACESLRRGECGMAIAGGVNLNLHPSRLGAMAQAKLICEDGESRSFGAGGKGFLAGEGVAAVVLKPLAAAQRDGDTIHAVIKGSAVGHSGSTLNYFSPSSRGQGRVIAKALDSAGVTPAEVDYVEMQCAGDEATDAAEFEAIKTAYQTQQRTGGPLRIGSVKPNVGHAEAAAGMAQLLKTVMQLKHRTFVKTLTREVLNPQLNFAGANIAIQQDVDVLPDVNNGSARLRLAINAAGAGGTAAHVIVESSVPVERDSGEEGVPQLLVLSARSRKALHRAAEALACHLELAADKTATLADIAYTLQMGRRECNHRLAIVAESIEGALASLREWLAGSGQAGNGRAFVSPLEGVTAGAGSRQAVSVQAEPEDLAGLAQRWTSGMPIDWRKPFAYRGHRVSLPGYPFELRAYWPDSNAAAALASEPGAAALPPAAGSSPTAAASAKEAEPMARPASGLLESIATPADAVAHIDAQIESIAEHLHLTTVGILYAVMQDKGVVFEEHRGADGAFSLYLRPAGGDGEAAERSLERMAAAQANGGVFAPSGGLRERIGARAMNVAGRLLERLPGRAEQAAGNLLKRLPGAEGVKTAYLLKRLARTPFIVTDETGARLALPATIRSRKQLEELRSQYEISLRALPEYQSYCELLAAIVSGILDGRRPGAEHVAAASALLVDMFTAPSKLAFLNRLTADLCLAERFAGQRTISVLAIGAGGFEFLASIVAAAPPDTRIEYNVASGWSQIATGVAELGHERFPGVSFASFVPMLPGALAERLGEGRFDVVIVNTQDPCAQEAIALFDKLAADPRGSLAFVTGPIDTRGLELILDLTDMWPPVVAEPGIADGRALGEALTRAGFRHHVVVDAALEVFSREASPIEDDAEPTAGGPSEAQLAEICEALLTTFADALEDGGAIDAERRLADVGIPSMTWALIFAKLQRRFGKVIEPALFAEAGGEASLASLTRLLAGKLHGGVALPPIPNGLGEKVMQRLVEIGQTDFAFAHTARLTRGEFTSSRGQVFEYFEHGSGPALIFLSALAFSKSIWEDQIREFGDRYRLIFPHLPGHGGSRYTGTGFTFEDLADDLVELMDALGVGEAHLVGWCIAGNIAQLLALRHPQRLKSLALVCTTPTDARMRGITQKSLEDYSASPLMTYQLEFNNIYREDFLVPEVARSLAIIRQTHVPVEPQALLNFIGSLFAFDTRDRLHEIKTPTLIVAGSRDIAFPIDQVALLKDGIRHARFVVFEKGGHLPFLNQRGQFNEALRMFLADVVKGERMSAVPS